MCLKRSELLSHGPLLQHPQVPLSKARIVLFKTAMSDPGLEMAGLEESGISGIGGGYGLCLWYRVWESVCRGQKRTLGCGV